jgi:Bacterial membrane protein YfhO
VANSKFINNDDQVLSELAVSDPLGEVVISGKGHDITGRTMGDGDWKASVTRYTGNEVVIVTHSEKPGFLVLSDTYYPGWQATIDGRKTPVMRANYDFRTVSLPNGDHTVVFRFKPRSFKAGLLGSLIGLCFVGFSCIGFLNPKFSLKGRK